MRPILHCLAARQLWWCDASGASISMLFFSPLKCKARRKDVKFTFPYRTSKITHLFQYSRYYGNGVLAVPFFFILQKVFHFKGTNSVWETTKRMREQKRKILFFWAVANPVSLAIFFVSGFVIMFLATPNYVLSNNVTILARVLFLVFFSEPWSSVIFGCLNSFCVFSTSERSNYFVAFHLN